MHKGGLSERYFEIPERISLRYCRGVQVVGRMGKGGGTGIGWHHSHIIFVLKSLFSRQ